LFAGVGVGERERERERREKMCFVDWSAIDSFLLLKILENSPLRLSLFIVVETKLAILAWAVLHVIVLAYGAVDAEI
jgi:hypothetical protein